MYVAGSTTAPEVMIEVEVASASVLGAVTTIETSFDTAAPAVPPETGLTTTVYVYVPATIVPAPGLS